MKDLSFLDAIKRVEDFPTTGFVDTSSYALNALISASIYGGLPDNRSTMFAGEQSTGKTYLTLGTVQNFLNEDPDAICVWYDTEFALDEEMLSRRGVDTNRLILQQPETLQQFRSEAFKTISEYEKVSEKSRPKMMIVLDSLGQLPTQKEVEDALKGVDVRDMTKAQVIKSVFRILTLKMGKLNIPMVVCNHTYDSMDQYKPKEISGGSGSKYAASSIITLSKAKDKEGDDVVGNIITATTYKSRYSRESQKVKLKLNFETGLDRYYGLLELGEEAGVFKKVSTRYELSDGTKVWGKDINENPAKFYTKDVLDRIDEYVKGAFGFGSAGAPVEQIETDEVEETIDE